MNCSYGSFVAFHICVAFVWFIIFWEGAGRGTKNYIFFFAVQQHYNPNHIVSSVGVQICANSLASPELSSDLAIHVFMWTVVNYNLFWDKIFLVELGKLLVFIEPLYYFQMN